MKWNVWSIDDAKGRALVVSEGSEGECTDGAERRNKTAARLDVSLRFEALPDGQEPEW
jgi:hypothetical protein